MNKLYLLKGGLIASIIGIILALISIKIEALNWFTYPLGVVGLMASTVLFGCNFLDMGWSAGDTETAACKMTDNISAWVAIILGYFILGIIITWIYKKIKNRKQVTATVK